METHEREYLVSQIIYGGKIIEFKDLTLIVKPLTIEQQYFAQRVFKKVYKSTNFTYWSNQQSGCDPKRKG